MFRFILSCFLIVLLAPVALANDACILKEVSGTAAPLKRGINLSVWWENGAQPGPSSKDVEQLYELGFDFVRLPVSPHWFDTDDADEQQKQIDQLHCDLVKLLNAGLNVMLDLHPDWEFKEKLAAEKPDEALAHLTHIWEVLGESLNRLPPQRITLGLYNEPRSPGKAWWNFQGKLVKALRQKFPQHRFVVMASLDKDSPELPALKPYADGNIIYDFHFYTPMFFTHHGAEWLRTHKGSGPIAYPVNTKHFSDDDDADTRAYIAEGWNRNKLSSELRKLINWKKRYGVRLGCFEFGVYHPHTDAQSRANWLGDMRQLLEAAHIPWALWEYRGGFGLFESEKPDEEVAKALGLNYGLAP